MSSYPWWSGGHRLAGTTRLLVGFVVGALFALFPMYYFYTGRDAGTRGGTQDATSASPVEAYRTSAEAGASGASKPFASRMTYELSQVPEERLPAPAKAPAPVAAAPTPAVRPADPPAPPLAALPEPAERVANARPISAIPPDPRDRTREIEKEAQKPEYRDPGRTAKAPPSVPVGKVIEGREVELKPRLPDTPTRPIVAGGATDSRAEIEAERNRRPTGTPAPRVALQAGDAGSKASDAASTAVPSAQVAGVTPITRPPSPPASRSDAAVPKLTVVETKSAASASEVATAASSDVQTRLEATREWLAASPPATHTIQLMGTNSEEQLKAHLKSLSKMLEPAKIYIFRTLAQGKPSITVVYGAYPDRSAAAQALEKLPSAITANRPVLRTVNGIRTEMKQHKIDG